MVSHASTLLDCPQPRCHRCRRMVLLGFLDVRLLSSGCRTLEAVDRVLPGGLELGGRGVVLSAVSALDVGLHPNPLSPYYSCPDILRGHPSGKTLGCSRWKCRRNPNSHLVAFGRYRHGIHSLESPKLPSWAHLGRRVAPHFRTWCRNSGYDFSAFIPFRLAKVGLYSGSHGLQRAYPMGFYPLGAASTSSMVLLDL